MDFQLFHQYNRLVRRGLTKPLLHGCGSEYVVQISDEPDVKPVLVCFGCQAKVYPGLNMYNDIRAVVKEHFV